jgi:hypothetical protein
MRSSRVLGRRDDDERADSRPPRRGGTRPARHSDACPRAIGGRPAELPSFAGQGEVRRTAHPLGVVLRWADRRTRRLARRRRPRRGDRRCRRGGGTAHVRVVRRPGEPTGVSWYRTLCAEHAPRPTELRASGPRRLGAAAALGRRCPGGGGAVRFGPAGRGGVAPAQRGSPACGRGPTGLRPLAIRNCDAPGSTSPPRAGRARSPNIRPGDRARPAAEALYSADQPSRISLNP